MAGADIPEPTLRELATQAAARWPQPWLAATLYSVQTRNLVGIPIAEYFPDQLVNGRIALVGDAAHVLTPLTAAGFNASLQDAVTLADCVARVQPGAGTVEALWTMRRIACKPSGNWCNPGNLLAGLSAASWLLPT